MESDLGLGVTPQRHTTQRTVQTSARSRTSRVPAHRRLPFPVKGRRTPKQSACKEQCRTDGQEATAVLLFQAAQLPTPNPYYHVATTGTFQPAPSTAAATTTTTTTTTKTCLTVAIRLAWAFTPFHPCQA